MALAYSNTTSKNGIIQRIERELGFEDGQITGNALLLAQFTGDVNLAHDSALSIAFESGGTWKFDDANHTDYPIITTDLVDGQRDYSFTTDGSGNMVLDIYKVFLKDNNGTYNEIEAVDVEGDATGLSGFTDGANATGIPLRYDKLSNSIFLDPIPSYNSTDGLKVYISREGSYFTTTDTSKKPGIDGRLHEYYVIAPCYNYACMKSLANKNDLLQRKLLLEQKIAETYASRTRDERPRLEITQENNK